MQSSAIAARNHLGAVRRHHPDDQNRVDAARRELAVAKLSDYIAKTVASAPPLTDEQRQRLALLLSSGGPSAA